MSDELLSKIFRQPAGVPADGMVSGKKGPGLWSVTDRMGRTMTAISDEQWRPGVDWVTVQDGRIIARARRRAAIQVYKV